MQAFDLLFGEVDIGASHRSFPLDMYCLLVYTQDSRTRGERQEACSPTSTSSTAHEHNIRPSTKPSARCSLSATSACVSGWILVGPTAMICSAHVLTWPATIPLLVA